VENIYPKKNITSIRNNSYAILLIWILGYELLLSVKSNIQY